MNNKILFAELSEDGTVGGSHQAMTDTIRDLDRHRFTPLALFYEENRHADLLRKDEVGVWIWNKIRRQEKEQLDGQPRHRQIMALAAAIARRRRFLNETGVDVLHLNNSPALGYDDWLPAARLSGTPIVAQVAGELRIPKSWWKSRLIKSYDRYIAVSQHIRANLVREGIASDRIRTNYPGVDIETFRDSATLPPDDVRRRLGIEPAQIVIAMVGNIREWKGQHVALEAVVRLDASIQSRIRLLLIGATSESDRAYETKLKSFCEQHELQSSVLFLGCRTDVPDLMNASDVVVHASIQPEPFGLVVVEGMAMGKPVVASKFGGPAEILTEDTGLLFDPRRPGELADHLAVLAKTPELGASLGERARERAVAFDLGPSVKGIEQVYEGLLSETASSTARRPGMRDAVERRGKL